VLEAQAAHAEITMQECCQVDLMNEKKPPLPLQAIALKYDNTKDAAPKVAAKGKNLVAERILEIAAEYGIPVHQDADLVEVLKAVELQQEIPLEVYTVVAEIFAYIYRMNQKSTPKKATF